MPLGQALLPEFEREFANTHKTLERVPDDKFDWMAHEKLNSIGWVAGDVPKT